MCFNAKLLFVEPEVTILRHNANCRGVIKNGRCTVCGEESIGEPSFYVSFMPAWHRLRTRSQTRVQTAPSHSK